MQFWPQYLGFNVFNSYTVNRNLEFNLFQLASFKPSFTFFYVIGKLSKKAFLTDIEFIININAKSNITKL